MLDLWSEPSEPLLFPPQTLRFMNDKTLKGKKLEAYVILKILKYCTDSSARSYQCKFAVQQVFLNKKIESMEELGAAIKEIIHYKTIRGKFSSVDPDLAAEGITKVEVGEEGLHFIRNNQQGELSNKIKYNMFNGNLFRGGRPGDIFNLGWDGSACCHY